MSVTNTVPLLDMTTSTTGCCAKFEPKDWDNKTFTFHNKLFVKATVRSVGHMPLNMGSVMSKVQTAIEEAGADTDEFVMLSYDPSSWKSDHYLAVSKEVPGYSREQISGTFLAKVFEGPYREAGKWDEQLTEFAQSRGTPSIKNYFYYTTCPRCAKEYGKNYVVGFAKISESG